MNGTHWRCTTIYNNPRSLMEPRKLLKTAQSLTMICPLCKEVILSILPAHIRWAASLIPIDHPTGYLHLKILLDLLSNLSSIQYSRYTELKKFCNTVIEGKNRWKCIGGIFILYWWWYIRKIFKNCYLNWVFSHKEVLQFADSFQQK